MSGERVTWEQVRDDLWKWYAFESFENVDLDAISDEQFDRVDDAIEALFAALCGVAGHRIIDDQCGLPEHRFCVFCRGVGE